MLLYTGVYCVVDPLLCVVSSIWQQGVCVDYVSDATVVMMGDKHRHSDTNEQSDIGEGDTSHSSAVSADSACDMFDSSSSVNNDIELDDTDLKETDTDFVDTISYLDDIKDTVSDSVNTDTTLDNVDNKDTCTLPSSCDTHSNCNKFESSGIGDTLIGTVESYDAVDTCNMFDSGDTAGSYDTDSASDTKTRDTFSHKAECNTNDTIDRHIDTQSNVSHEDACTVETNDNVDIHEDDTDIDGDMVCVSDTVVMHDVTRRDSRPEDHGVVNMGFSDSPLSLSHQIDKTSPITQSGDSDTMVTMATGEATGNRKGEPVEILYDNR